MDISIFNKELSRCLSCRMKPCEKACPLGVSPHDFIIAAKNNDYNKASALIAEKNPLPQTCGLVCPDKFCQKACIRAKIDTPIEIPCLQAKLMCLGNYPQLVLPEANHKKVAVIGGGPAGLGALHELLMAGYAVDLYEKSSVLGGAARLIPEYRLPRMVLDMEINRLTQNKKTKIILNSPVTDFENLRQQYDGVILALGEPIRRTLGIKGENHCLSYHEYLSNPQHYAYQKVAISGGGEVALDCAITLKKNGCKDVEMFVRRRREDMRIMARDQQELDDLAIKINDLTSITEVSKFAQTYDLRTIKNRLNNQGKAEPLTGTESTLKGYDAVIQALGSYYPKEDLPKGYIIAGDMTGLCGTIVQALASGKTAARQLINGDA